MEFVDQIIIEILERTPSECAYLDYKEYSYPKDKKHDFIKDIIAMLNSDEGIGKDKVIIFGVVDKSRYLKGLDVDVVLDDNIYQNWLNSIKPRPSAQSGSVEFDGKMFGYVFIHKTNLDRVYEVNQTVVGDSNASFCEKNAAYKGQAYSRHGSTNYIMMREDRDKIKDSLLKSSYQYANLSYDQEYISKNLSMILIASIIGSWNESYEGDIKVIENISGTKYNKFVNYIRKFYDENPEQCTYENNQWKVNNRKEIIDKLATQVYDENFESISNQISNVLLEVNPKYELEADKRFAASIYGKKRVYSNAILLGLTEFMALAGISSSIFTSCSKYKVYTELKNIITKVFNTHDWKVYASLSEVFQPIAESCPEVFLQGLQRRLEEKQPSLMMYLHEGEKGVAWIQYGYQLAHILSILACLPEYFSESCYTLLLLSKENDNLLSNLIGILLPWFPQTNATKEARIGIVKGFFNENEDLAWKVLIPLLPGKTTTGSPIARPKYLQHENIPEKVSNKEYWHVSKEYLIIASNNAKCKPEKLAQLVEFLDNLPKDGFQILIKTFEESCKSISKDEQKELVWNALKDFVNKHRKYKDAKWSLPDEALEIIEEVISKYQPESLLIQMRRMFQDKQYDLIWDEDNFEEKEKILLNIQEESINKIFNQYGYAKVKDFAVSVDKAEIVGRCLVDHSIEKYEIEEICSFLVGEDNKLKQFSRGYIEGNLYKKGYIWMNYILNIIDNDIIKACILSILPLSKESLKLIESIDDNAKEYFWKNVRVWSNEIIDADEIEYVNKQLIDHNRATDAIELLYHLIKVEKVQPKIENIIYGLNALVSQNNNTRELNSHAVISLIGWLQKNNESKEELVLIEWKYLNLLNGDYGVEPLTLYKSLSDEPDFFIEVLSKAYRGHHEEPKELNEEEKIIASHCGKLLFSWKRTPGLIDENTLDEDLFKIWVEKVVNVSKELDRYEVAMTYLGHTLYYAPKDLDGFFINNCVARLMQNDVEKHIRNGYSIEAYNSRGAYFVDSSGKTEFELEEKFLKYAEAAEERGYFRFGSTLREVAKSYHQEAIHNIEEERKWNAECAD